MIRKKFTLRASIILLLASLVSFTGGIIILVSYIGSRSSVHDLTDQIMNNAARNVIEQTINYLNPGARSLKLTNNLIQSGVLDITNEPGIARYFKDVLLANNQFEMFYIGNPKGDLLMQKRMPDFSFSLKDIKHREEQVFTEWTHEHEKWEKLYARHLIEPKEIGYDATNRPWYQKALEQKGLIWTDIYIFFSDQQPGITCAYPILDKNGKTLGVLGLDMSVSGLSHFLGRLDIVGRGKAFILNSKSQIIAFPTTEDFDLKQLIQTSINEDKKSYSFLPVEKINDREIAESFRIFKNTITNQPNQLETSQPIHFTYRFNKNDFLAMYYPFPSDSGFDGLIGVIVPEVDVMGRVYRNNQIMLSISFFLILIAVLLGFFLSQKLSISLANLAKQLEQIKHFKLDLYTPISSWITEVQKIGVAFDQMIKGMRSFSKYVPADLVRELILIKKEAVLGGEKKILTISFSDVVGFTSIAEQLLPEELVVELADYLNDVSQIIDQYQGTVDKYIGDAVMAIWGAPKEVEQHALLACQAALKTQKTLAELAQKRKNLGKIPFRTRIGINTGEVIVGNIGAEKRLNYTAVGDNVNLASRLEDLNKYYETDIIISEFTHDLAKDHIEVRLLDYVAVRGKNVNIAIYELLSEKGGIPEDQLQFVNFFSEGVEQYREKNWNKAVHLFEKALQYNKDDRPSQIYIARCQKYKITPPDTNWLGGISFTTKYEEH